MRIDDLLGLFALEKLELMNITALREFDNHQALSFICDPRVQLKGFVAVHRNGGNEPALGATRLWEYKSEEEAIRDALRLSRLMSYKSAMAGLPYGGAKAVLFAPHGILKDRKEFFRRYAQKINEFRGRFITGTDVGVNERDIKIMEKETPYVIGSRVNPALFTAFGVVYGIEASLNHVFGSEEIEGRTFAIQGIGKVGHKILELLYKYADKIFISDVDVSKTEVVKRRFPRTEIVPPSDIHKQVVDVFVPCALGGVLSTERIPELNCKIIAGSANNQLGTPQAGILLHSLNILYAPDYVINSGGLIAVADELENKIPSRARIAQCIPRIKKNLKAIFGHSEKHKCATSVVADEMAEKNF